MSKIKINEKRDYIIKYKWAILFLLLLYVSLFSLFMIIQTKEIGFSYSHGKTEFFMN